MIFLKRAVVILLVWVLVGPAPARATHLLGGELTYRFLNTAGPAGRPWRYQVTARLYCSKELGSSAPDGPLSVPLKIYSKGAAPGLLLAVNVLRDSFTEITPPAPPGCLALAPRVTLALYDTVFSLPAVPDGFVAQSFSASRNGGVANIVAPTTTGMVLSVDLAPGTLPNSSPEFVSDAVLVVCAGQVLPALTNATDAEGDRLSYSLAAPAGDLYFVNPIPTAVPVTYAAGYGATQPFGGGGLATIDASTGLSTYFSLRQGFFVLAVEVREYRLVGGQEVLLSTLRRDMQLAVVVCSGPANSPPAFTPATLGQRSVQVAEGQAIQLTIAATDPDNQLLTMTVSSALLDGAGPIQATLNGQPGSPVGTRAVGVVKATGTGAVTGIFSLAAACGMARPAPYDVAVLVTDEACASRSIAEVFRITVVRPRLLLRVQGDSAVCAGSTATYTAVGPPQGQYQWAVRGGQLVGPATGRTVQVRWATAGPGRATASGGLAGGCRTDSVAQAVAIGSGPAVAGPTSYCPRTRTDMRYTIAGPPAAYQWALTAGTLLSGQGTNEVRIAVPEGATATLEVSDPAAAGCPTRLRISPDTTCLNFFTVITPNGDHQNDVFVIENIQYHPHTSLIIFDRWGRKMFQTTDYQNTYDGAGASAGLYYYLCQLPDGPVYKGWFEVVR